ncbi:hypothetical protein ACFOOK_06470 [Micromonospora krabiensis]|uniref:Uncharacterized protein n=1 Tax=Micromonospora krabiensis TaxID=307121 RepID=A0A1C3NCM7_9ACTN|nr:hypothetical protein [Micromonospora krabiensis]SBV30357.1 hypothetical protein GA0070620_5954 [Micromonospora krabiensis]
MLHAHADSSHNEHLNVIFEDVRAVKLCPSYDPLILQPAEHDTRANILAFARIPERHLARYLCLTLPTTDTEPGFIACAQVTVLANTVTDPGDAYTWNAYSRLLHQLREPTPT